MGARSANLIAFPARLPCYGFPAPTGLGGPGPLFHRGSPWSEKGVAPYSLCGGGKTKLIQRKIAPASKVKRPLDKVAMRVEVLPFCS